jgi:hypothetical protein
MIEVVRDVGGITWTVWQDGKVHAAYTSINTAFGTGVRELLALAGPNSPGDTVRIVDHNGLAARIEFNENHVGKSW